MIGQGILPHSESSDKGRRRIMLRRMVILAAGTLILLAVGGVTLAAAHSAEKGSSDAATAIVNSAPDVCTMNFPDVPPGSTSYNYIHCIYCQGIISGYPDGTFRPNTDVTRGQLSKIVI